ncbi:hypothetical protein KY335_04630, partial [Candidatus Woesearchaeota archaeon]|nr:hypothetical protein [Candidatus Woesearchaeota archaeon]
SESKAPVFDNPLTASAEQMLDNANRHASGARKVTEEINEHILYLTQNRNLSREEVETIQAEDKTYQENLERAASYHQRVFDVYRSNSEAGLAVSRARSEAQRERLKAIVAARGSDEPLGQLSVVPEYRLPEEEVRKRDELYEEFSNSWIAFFLQSAKLRHYLDHVEGK